ncbi:Peptidase C1 and/or Propeptide C1 domain containing protein, partial [Asbolus verrucosus]
SDALSDDFINSINEAQSSWRAGKVWPKNTTEEFLNGLSGAVDPATYIHEYEHLIDYRPQFRDAEGIPNSFDAREKWPKCASIGKAPNQGKCGSCWAVAVASVFTDRYCINTKGAVNEDFSAEDILTCCGSQCIADPMEPCRGGRVYYAWKFAEEQDNVYNRAEAKKCRSDCPNQAYGQTYHQDKQFVKGITFFADGNVQKIQNEIMNNGPVVAHMEVFTDFETYTRGVYMHERGKPRDNQHAVKLIGWGQDKLFSYWLGVNSWGKNWGFNGGLFKIARGRDECKIESAVLTGNIDLNKLAKMKGAK